MTSLENIARRHALPAARAASSAASSARRCSGRRRREAREKARALLAYCGLPKRAENEYARNLAYGDQRRLEVARALATEPKLLLLDEPTAGMNPQETQAFIAFVRKVRDERGLTVLLIEHDMKVVLERLRARDRARPRREDRRGPAGRRDRRRARARGLSRHEGERDERVAAAATPARPLLALDGRPRLLRRDPRAQGRLARASATARSSRCSAPTARASRRRSEDDLRAAAPAQGHDPLRGRRDHAAASARRSSRHGIAQSPEGRRCSGA